MEIEVRPVRSAQERRAFLTFPWRIYREDPLWVPPLLPDRAQATDPRRGMFFRRGEAEFFIAWQGKKPVGTISAAEDRFDNQSTGQHECMFGFFDCVADYAVAKALFDAAAGWARARGLTSLMGPFHLDRENAYGILIEGRDRPPALLCGHTPPYYRGFVERYGMKPGRPDNVALCIDIDQDTPELAHLARLADKVRARKQFVIRQPDLAHWDDEIDRIRRLLNVSLAHLADFRETPRDAVVALVEPFRKIADMELVLFADADGETVGWLPGIANLNEVFQHVNGLRYPWNYIQLWRGMRRRTESLTIKSVLVHPDYWRSGVAVLLFDEMARRARAKGYQWVDLSITAEDNPQTILIGEHLGARIYKRWRVYRMDLA